MLPMIRDSFCNSLAKLWEEWDSEPSLWRIGVACDDRRYLKSSFRETQAKKLMDLDPTLTDQDKYWINRFCRWEIDGVNLDNRLRSVIGDCAMDALSFLAKAIKTAAKVLYVSIMIIAPALGGGLAAVYCVQLAYRILGIPASPAPPILQPIQHLLNRLP